jgi:hypothetical protein
MTDGRSLSSASGVYVNFDGSNNPIIGYYVGNRQFSFAALGMASLSSGLNTLTFKAVTMGNGIFITLVLNGVESLGVSGIVQTAGWKTGVRLASSSDAIVSASKV